MIRALFYNEKPRAEYEHWKKRDQIDYESGAIYEEVPSSAMPHGIGWRALGAYFPAEHRILIDKDRPEKEKITTRYHESSHAQGSRDEFQTDLNAAARSGDVGSIRGPFYRPPAF